MMEEVTVFPVIRNSKYGLMDLKGNSLTGFNYMSLGSFSEGICIGNYHENGNLVNELINFSGEVIYKTHDIIRTFSQGMALALNRENNKYGFIDHSGNYKILPVFDSENEEAEFYTNPVGFSENKTFVLSMKEVACINTDGHILFKNPEYKEAYRFCDGLTLVEDIDRTIFFVTPENNRIDIVPQGYSLNPSVTENYTDSETDIAESIKMER